MSSRGPYWCRLQSLGLCAPQRTGTPSTLQPTNTRIQSTAGFYSNLFFFNQDLTLGLSLKRGYGKKEASAQPAHRHVRALSADDFGMV